MAEALPSLLLFARAPAVGRVKTRLAPRLTEAGAARLYRAFLEDAARSYGTAATWQPVLAGEPDAEEPWLAEIFPPPWRRVTQGGGDLGERLTRAFDGEFARGAPAVLAVGADHPCLPRESLGLALRLLGETSCAVAIPADDGGYCAIAFAAGAPYQAAFREISWSSPRVLQETRAHLSRAGVVLALLPAAYDVDRPEDLERLRRDLAGRDPSAADYPRATARVLEEFS